MTNQIQMPTDSSQGTQLTNNNIQVFKFNNDRALELNGINIIARKEDGYVNLNKLCKAGFKHFRNGRKLKKHKNF